MSVFDLHIHTTFSDGVMDVETVLKIAEKLKFTGVSITDHDTLKGSLKALAIQKNYNVLVIPGIEVSTKYGHILVYGLTELKYSSIDELYDVVHENGGLIAIAHPYGRLLFFKYPIVDMDDLLEKADAIECTNGRVYSKCNVKAYVLSEKFNKPCIGGSDAHIPEEIGSTLTLVYENIESIDDFISAVKKGKTKTLGSKSLLSIMRSIIAKRIKYLRF